MITVDGLSKTCRIPYRKKGDDHFRTIREAVMDAATAPWRRLRPTEATSEDGPATFENFRALKDISFSVEQGEVIGIIGCNGAGKSTPLKILTRITEPSAGLIEMHGRVGPGFPLDQMFATARIVMGRRGKTFCEAEEQLYLQLFEQTRLERERAFHRAHDHRAEYWPVAQAARLEMPLGAGGA